MYEKSEGMPQCSGSVNLDLIFTAYEYVKDSKKDATHKVRKTFNYMVNKNFLIFSKSYSPELTTFFYISETKDILSFYILPRNRLQS